MKLTTTGALLLGILFLSACGSDKNFEGVKNVKINAILSSEDGAFAKNKTYDATLKIEGMGKWLNPQTQHKVVGYQRDPYTGKDMYDNPDNINGCYVYHPVQEKDFDKIPKVYLAGSIVKKVDSDSNGVIKSFWALSEGSFSTQDLGPACTTQRPGFESVGSINYALALTVTKDVCSSYCGVKVKTYCEQGCTTSNTWYYYGPVMSSQVSCKQACLVEETPFCNTQCSAKKFLLAQASVYGDDINKAVAPGTSEAETPGPVKSVKREGDVIVFDIELKLEAYTPLHY